MKINELNMFQKMLGDFGQGAKAMAAPTNTQGVGAAAVKARQSGLSTEDQLAQDSFVKKFVSRGANALNTAIAQGLVDVNSSDLSTAGAASGTAGQQGQAGGAGGQAGAPAGQAAGGPNAATQARIAAAPNGYDPQTGKPNPAPNAPGAKVKAPGDAAIATGQKQGAEKPAIDQNVDKIVSAMRKLQPAGTKPLPPTSKLAQEITKDLANVSMNKDYLIRVGDKILKLDNAGYDVKNLHQQFMGQYAKGNKQKTIQESMGEERLTEIYQKLSTERFRNALKKAGYDPDLAVDRIESLLAKKRKEAEDRDRFLKTNEGIVDKVKGFFGKKPAAPAAGAQPAAAAAPQAGTAPAAGQPAQGAAKPSMGAWLRDNFMKGFLRGIDLGTSQQQIDDILKRMPQSLKAKTLNKDLTDIANIAWAVSDQGRKQDTQP